MSKCTEKCEVYSRVCGYFRPTSNWNKGKQEEFKERKVYKTFAILGVLTLLTLTGCTATKTVAKGISEKSISGSGSIIHNRVGLDKTTQTPELSSLFVWGDYTSVNDDGVIRYEKTEDASIFNSNAKTKKIKIVFASPDKEIFDEVLNVIKNDLSKPQTKNP